jgi:hypothetical protein
MYISFSAILKPDNDYQKSSFYNKSSKMVSTKFLAPLASLAVQKCRVRSEIWQQELEQIFVRRIKQTSIIIL